MPEDQLAALGLVLNATVLWNTIYLDQARAQREAAGRPIIPEEMLAGSARWTIHEDRSQPLSVRGLEAARDHSWVLG